MKYIDADKLIVEIDRQKIGYNTDGEHAAEYNTCRKILDIITSLLQEQQEVDLEKEINKWLDGPTTDLRTMARHFFELGKNSK